MYTREQVIEKSTEYFNGDTLAATVFADKYALRDDNENLVELTPDDMHKRLAKELARIEQKYPNPLSEQEIYESIKKFQHIVPQGSPMAGIGNYTQLTSLSNCFVIDPPYDSYSGILRADQELTQVYLRRGGAGLDVSTIRPKGLPTKNAARTTDGIAVFMERYSNTTREVATAGRRAALMISISVHHPEIETFIKIKKNKTKVTGANISIRLSDEFMNAVKSETTYEQRWPVDSKTPKIKHQVDAKHIWNQIIESAWESAEPGILFWDNIIKNGAADAYKEYESKSTNPCAELPLSPYDSCRLVAMNTLSFVKNPYTKDAYFDYDSFEKYSKKAQRLMDDIIDLETEHVDRILNKIHNDPEPEDIKRNDINLWNKIRTSCNNGRRCGTGVTAIGDTLAALGIKYGSEESIKVVEEIYKALELAVYKQSIELAEERGAFPIYDYETEKNHGFISKVISNLPEDYQEKYKKYGRRNIALTTTAPGGSVSILTQTTSGIEPVFRVSYDRRKKINQSEQIEADYTDVMGDKWKVFKVYHPQFSKWSEVTGKTSEEESPWFGSTANDIDWSASVDIQAVAQRWVCASISKTCNLPNSVSKETVADVYMKAWETGCKGFTVYRDGSRDGVLITTEEKKENKKFAETNAPKRPETLECDIHHIKIKGENWIVFVGLLEGKVFEVFAGLSKYVSIPKKVLKGKIVKKNSKKENGSSIYDLVYGEESDPTIIKDIVRTFENPTEGAFTRLLSLSIRHGGPLHHIVQQLQKDEYSDIYSFSRVIARVLKSYIKDGTKVKSKCANCGGENLAYQENCLTCLDCGNSKCS